MYLNMFRKKVSLMFNPSLGKLILYRLEVFSSPAYKANMVRSKGDVNYIRNTCYVRINSTANTLIASIYRSLSLSQLTKACSNTRGPTKKLLPGLTVERNGQHVFALLLLKH